MVKAGFFHGKSPEWNRGDVIGSRAQQGHLSRRLSATLRQASPTSRCLRPC